MMTSLSWTIGAPIALRGRTVEIRLPCTRMDTEDGLERLFNKRSWTLRTTRAPHETTTRANP
jgi:hypothetical protein